jgi:glycosyltransferase involved in cell wall biosynthesis
MRMCDAYAAAGLDVELVTPRTTRDQEMAPDDVWDAYAVEPRFVIRQLPLPMPRGVSSRRFRLTATAAVIPHSLRLAGRGGIVHARHPALAAPLLALPRRPTVVLETHALPRRRLGRLYRRADLVVVNSEALRAALAPIVAPTEVLHAPLGPHATMTPGEPGAARQEIGLPADAPVACFAGSVNRAQNELLLAAAARVVERHPDFRLVLVGGRRWVVLWTLARAESLGIGRSVVAVPAVAPSRVPVYLAAADVLIWHMDPATLHYAWATPAKAFEYMAARRPIVATPLPLADEVFGAPGERAVQVAGEPAALADAIAGQLDAPDDAMAARAAAWVADRTWQRRVELILDAIGATSS